MTDHAPIDGVKHARSFSFRVDSDGTPCGDVLDALADLLVETAQKRASGDNMTALLAEKEDRNDR